MSDVHSWKIFDDRILVAYTKPGPISDAVWDRCVEDILSHNTLEFGLGVSYGSVSVNSVQRKKMADAFRDQNVFGVVITDDRLTRGIMTAISWMGAKFKAFSWEDAAAAVNYIDTAPRIRQDILQSVLSFYSERHQVAV